MINYLLITKPGIILGNLITVAAGFLLASKGTIDIWLFLATMLGLTFIMASACVLNNYIDRPLDKKMSRTKNRALVTGLITGKSAILFAIILEVIGTGILFEYTNLLTVGVATVGFIVYVFLYSMWKSKTVYGTAIGSVAGAVPPLVGYCAVSNTFDAGAAILFAILILWQMPHFFAIAMFNIKDYTAAGIPVLPIEKGAYETKVHMVLYIVAFIAAAALLTVFNYTGYIYLVVAVTLGLAWLVLCLEGFKTNNDHKWAKQMFRLSLVIIAAISLAIPFDIIK